MFALTVKLNLSWKFQTNDGRWMWRKSETTTTKTKTTRLAPKFKKIRRTLKAHFRRSSRRALELCRVTL